MHPVLPSTMVLGPAAFTIIFITSAVGWVTLHWTTVRAGEDGTVYVFGHNGWDNAYGEFDQSVVMDTFRLTKK